MEKIEENKGMGKKRIKENSTANYKKENSKFKREGEKLKETEKGNKTKKLQATVIKGLNEALHIILFATVVLYQIGCRGPILLV